MWILIFGTAFVAAILGFAYLCNRVYKMIPDRGAVCAYGKDIRLRLFVVLGSIITVVSLCSFLLGYINVIIIIVHLVVFWLLSDLLFFALKKIRKKKFGYNFAAVLAVAVALVYLVTGFVLANNVQTTRYDVYTEKKVGDLRIVMFADSHIGTTFDGEGFAEYVAEMQKCNPDIVVIAGDFVDDDTSLGDNCFL